ncbi:hypothetical protein D3C84_713640 [compost metagenome]
MPPARATASRPIRVLFETWERDMFLLRILGHATGALGPGARRLRVPHSGGAISPQSCIRDVSAARNICKPDPAHRTRIQSDTPAPEAPTPSGWLRRSDEALADTAPRALPRHSARHYPAGGGTGDGDEGCRADHFACRTTTTMRLAIQSKTAGNNLR